MFKMQNELQTLLVGKEWIEVENNYDLAIAVELAELIDHYGYKWWKKQNRDMVQCQLEVVDIFHFYMSGRMVKGCATAKKAHDTPSLDQVIRSEVDQMIEETDSPDYGGLETDDQILQGLQLALGRAGFCSFGASDMLGLMKLMNLDVDTLYRIYISKNALNIFRYKNGYKEGTYIKTWHGEEDNVHLDRVMKRLSSENNLTASALLDELSRVYASV